MNLCQWFTPEWAAQALVERHFPHLRPGDVVVQPSCGRGAFLKALPPWVEAIGVEVDPVVAAAARADTGRPVVVGDFRTAALEADPVAIVGNPPFVAEVVDQFLHRCHGLLPSGGRAGFILPAYLMQSSSRVAGYGERWSLHAEMIPRDLFPRLREALCFVVFTKDTRRVLVGLALYREAFDVARLPEPVRQALRSTEGPTWRQVCLLALRSLRGQGQLADIYAAVEGHRHHLTRFWREKVRQTLRAYPQDFTAKGAGLYALAQPQEAS